MEIMTCKRYPTLVFCKNGPVNPPEVLSPKKLSSPIQPKPILPKPTPSNLVPFDSDQFPKSLTSKSHPSRLSSMKPSTVSGGTKSMQQPKPSIPEPVPFDSERFFGRLGGGDFDRTDQLEGSRKEGENTTFQKISAKSRPLNGVDSRLAKIPPKDSNPIPFDTEQFGTNRK
uniref:Uncharacterized protein n=1 Tax=Panagrolaimus davidi TaxID=227884 RepID=A0A914P5G0_9BILA